MSCVVDMFERRILSMDFSPGHDPEQHLDTGLTMTPHPINIVISEATVSQV